MGNKAMISMTPKFGHESAAVSHRNAAGNKSSRDGAGGDDLDDLIDDISGKDVTTNGSIGSFKYQAPITINNC
jgi:hypothetical protein